jgi:hypothetical protein
MVKMVRKLCSIWLLLFLSQITFAQSEEEVAQGKAKQFIVEVMSRNKNPMSYYPLRRDIFLPTEEEQARSEMANSYPAGAKSLGHIVFIPSGDTTYYREPFVDASGDLLDPLNIKPTHYPSLSGNSSYFRKKQLAHLNRYPSLGKFLYFNASFASDSN